MIPMPFSPERVLCEGTRIEVLYHSMVSLDSAVVRYAVGDLLKFGSIERWRQTQQQQYRAYSASITTLPISIEQQEPPSIDGLDNGQVQEKGGLRKAQRNSVHGRDSRGDGFEQPSREVDQSQ